MTDPQTPDPDMHPQTHIDPETRIELEAAAFRRLRHHLMEERPDVQNIDLMTLAGFCRNCLSRWYQEAASARGIALDTARAREMFYGMSMARWKATHQTPATPEQRAGFADAHDVHKVGARDRTPGWSDSPAPFRKAVTGVRGCPPDIETS